MKRLPILTLLIVGSFACTIRLSAQCDPVMAHDTSQFCTNAEILASYTRGNTLYIGGSFRHIGQPSGHFGVVDAATGNMIYRAIWPKVNGRVTKAISDGAGGWIVGGNFTRVGDSARQNLVQIDAAGHVTAFNPSPDNPISTLFLSGGNLYVSGSFTHIAGASRTRLAKLKFPSGAVTSWSPNPDSTLSDIQEYDGILYVCGYFENIGGQARKYIAKLDTGTGNAFAWNANAAGYVVLTMLLSRDKVFVGGDFHLLGGAVRFGAACLDTGTALANEWMPDVSGRVHKLLFHGSNIYIAGSIAYVRALPRVGLAEVDSANGIPTSFDPTYLMSLDVRFYDMVISGDKLYLGGTRFGADVSYSGLNTLDIPTLSWNSTRKCVVDSSVYTLGISGPHLFVGGDFSVVAKGHKFAAAIDMAADTILGWSPGVEDPVYTIAGGPEKMYLGGMLSGPFNNGVVACDTLTGNVDSSFIPYIPHPVRSIVYDEGYIYIAGDFDEINYLPIAKVAKLNALTGIPDTSWMPVGYGYVPAVKINTLALDEANNLIVGGFFSSIQSQPRHNLASIDKNSGLVTSWSPMVNGPVGTVVTDNHKLLVGGQFDSVGSSAVKNLARVDMITALADPWTPNPNGKVKAITPYYNSDFIAGNFDSINTTLIRGLGTVNQVNNSAAFWNPSPDFDSVVCMSVHNERLYVFGKMHQISGDSSHHYFRLYSIQTIPDTINVTGNSSVCPGEIAHLLASTGVAGNYFWTVNGLNAGTNADTFSFVPIGTDTVRCKNVNTIPGCYTSDSVLSNAFYVVSNPLIVPSITVSAPSGAGTDSVVDLTATVSDAGGSYRIYWYNHGVLFNSTTIPFLSYTKGPGTDSITATVVSTSVGCYDSAGSAPVFINEIPVGISIAGENNLIQVYPNPAMDLIYIRGLKPDDQVSILDFSGRQVTFKVQSESAIEKRVLLEGYPAGVYLVRILDESGNIRGKFPVIRL